MIPLLAPRFTHQVDSRADAVPIALLPGQPDQHQADDLSCRRKEARRGPVSQPCAVLSDEPTRAPTLSNRIRRGS